MDILISQQDLTLAMAPNYIVAGAPAHTYHYTFAAGAYSSYLERFLLNTVAGACTRTDHHTFVA